MKLNNNKGTKQTFGGENKAIFLILIRKKKNIIKIYQNYNYKFYFYNYKFKIRNYKINLVFSN